MNSNKASNGADILNNVEDLVQEQIESAFSAVKRAESEVSGKMETDAPKIDLTLDPGGPKFSDYQNDYFNKPTADNPQDRYTQAAQSLGDLAGSRFAYDEPQPQPQSPPPVPQSAAYDPYTGMPINQPPPQSQSQPQPLPQPPPQNIQAPQTQQQAYYPPERKGKIPKSERPKKVGVVTAILGMISAAIFLIACTNGTDTDVIMSLIRISPGLLVFFGGEVLVGNIFAAGRRVKYDGLAILLCVGVSLLSFFGPQVVRDIERNSYTPQIVAAEQRVSSDALELYEQALLDNPVVAGVSIYTNLDTGYDRQWDDVVLEELLNNDNISVNVELNGPFDNAGAFAKSTYPVLQAMKEINLSNNIKSQNSHVNLNYSGNTGSVSLVVPMNSLNVSESWIKDNVSGYFYTEDVEVIGDVAIEMLEEMALMENAENQLG